MKFRNYKLCILLKILLLVSVLLSAVGYLLYNNIKNVVLNEICLCKNLELLNINYIFNCIKFNILSITLFLVIISVFILYHLVLKYYKALYVDYLTEVNSKKYYDSILKEFITKAKITNKIFSMMMIDVDGFKQINDVYGHDTGDKVLQHVAKTIRANIRSFDICCRFGGDEFSVILPNTKKEDAQLIGKRISERINNCVIKFDENNHIHIDVTISIGIAEWNNNMNIIKLSKCADDALYESKMDGRNRITVYNN